MVNLDYMMQFSSEHNELLEILRDIASVNGWEIANVIVASISLMLALFLSLRSYLCEQRHNWLKIEDVKIYTHISENETICNIGIKTFLVFDPHIPVLFDMCYIFLNEKISLGLKSITNDSDTPRFEQRFELVRTHGFQEKKLYEKMTMQEFASLDLYDLTPIKKGKIHIFTNVGMFDRKLKKAELKDMEKVLFGVKQQEKSRVSQCLL